MKRTKLFGKALSILLFALVLLVAGCAHGSGDTPVEEGEEDVTAKVINPEANQAGLRFMKAYDSPATIQMARENGFVYANNLGITEGSTSSFITGKQNQLADPGSGFTFSLRTKSPPTGLRAGIGFGSMFYLTAGDGNLGNSVYDALIAAVENEPVHEGGWIIPQSSVWTNLGIRVYTAYQGEIQDISNRVSVGINLAEKDNGKILFYYGAIIVDRAITDFAKEGKFIMAGEVPLWSDGAADNTITAEWWIGKQP